MKVQCAIYYGQILMTDVGGVFHQEEQDIPSVKTFLNSLIIQTAWNLSLEPIN